MADSDYLVSRHDMLSWNRDDDGATSSSTFMPDISGVGNSMTPSTGTHPTLTANALNGRSGWYWNGSVGPLSWSGVSDIAHIFILASFDETTFTADRGLVSGLTAAYPLLVTNSSGANFVDLTALGFPSTTYRKSNVIYPSSGAKAPVSGVAAVLELSYDGGAEAIDGLQVGQDRDITARPHKGYVYDVIAYASKLGDRDRWNIYKYFANRYHVWEKATDTGPWVFPWVAGWGSPDPRRKIVLSDENEDGSMVYRTKKTKKRYAEYSFSDRTQGELSAAEAFYDQHHPGVPFVYRDRTTTPLTQVTYRFAPDAGVDDATPTGPNRFQYKLKMNEV